MGVRMTLENFKLKLESLYPQLVLIGDYINLSTKTRFKCLECGYEFEKEPTIMFGKMAEDVLVVQEERNIL